MVMSRVRFGSILSGAILELNEIARAGTSISMICNMIILLVLLRRRIKGLEGKIILASFWKICLISILMAGGVYFILEGIPPLVWISATLSGIIRASP